MLFISTVFSFLPTVVFALGIVFAVVTMRRQPRRSTRALIGFIVLFVGDLGVHLWQLLGHVSFEAGEVPIQLLLQGIGYIVVVAVGLALVVSALFTGGSDGTARTPAPAAWGPVPAQPPHGGQGGTW